MTEEEFEQILSLGHEKEALEFKGSGARTDKHYLARVVRAILGMANHRDGGLVILGVEDAALVPVGLTDTEFESWLDYDDLTVSINQYASPSVQFDRTLKTFRGKNFVFIRVLEFDDIPILCAKDHDSRGKPVLRRGACYVRSRHKPETSEIPSEEEMRALLDLAVDKGLDKFVTRARRAGLLPAAPASPSVRSDEEHFEKQIEEIE